MGMFRVPPGLLAGIAYGTMAGLIPSARAKMAETKAKLAKEAGALKGKDYVMGRWRHPKHRANYHTLAHREYRKQVVATHTGGDHAKDPRADKYLNRRARLVRHLAQRHAELFEAV